MNLVQKNKVLDRDQFVELTPGRQKAFFDACGFLWIPNAIPVAAIEQVLTDLDAHAPRRPAAGSQHAALARGNRGGGRGGSAAPAGLLRAAGLPPLAFDCCSIHIKWAAKG